MYFLAYDIIWEAVSWTNVSALPPVQPLHRSNYASILFLTTPALVTQLISHLVVGV